MRLSAAERDKLLQSREYKCDHCGRDNVPLEIHSYRGHELPSGEGYNLDVLCPNCHRLLHYTPSEAHFAEFMFDLLRNSSRFKGINREAAVGEARLRPDFIASETLPGGEAREIVIECRSLSVLDGPRATEVSRQLESYRAATAIGQIVLAFPGKAPDDVVKQLEAQKIEIWDIDRIGAIFPKELHKSQDTYYGRLFYRSLARQRPEPKLIQDLNDCLPGHPGWATYQKLIGRALELSFCPPLNRPFSERADYEKINRRDFIFPNYASEGFWLTMRQRYGADYVLVDAKNSKGKITKSNILQIANYLKPHGVGQFAIIVGRSGPDRAAEITIREQWLMHSKLIVVLTRDDIEAMLLSRMAEGDPTDVLSDRIQQFRLLI